MTGPFNEGHRRLCERKGDATPRPRSGLARSTVAAALLSVLAGCAPDLGLRPTPLQASSAATDQTFGLLDGAWPAEGWWTSYGDDQLNRLEREAVSGSPTLRAAEARVRRAAAAVRRVRGEGSPQLSANGSVEGARQSLNQGFSGDASSGLDEDFRGQADLAVTLREIGRAHV